MYAIDRLQVAVKTKPLLRETFTSKKSRISLSFLNKEVFDIRVAGNILSCVFELAFNSNFIEIKEILVKEKEIIQFK